MNILAIETSCDETAAAVVAETDDADRPWTIRSSVVASQVAIHREWGGVVPELASRQHIRDICGVVERALTDAGLEPSGINAIAVTQGPGLVGSLLVGVAFAKALAVSWGCPLVPVHHLAGHIESLFLHNGSLPLPLMALVVSGGHTSLYLVPSDGEYHLVGRTRDDAAGEAYDKVAKLLGLGYPGGPVIDRLAREGNDRAIAFPIARMTHRDRNESPPMLLPSDLPAAALGQRPSPDRAGRGLQGPPLGVGQRPTKLNNDFSFSGIKTAVARYLARHYPDGQVPSADVNDICASFQRAVVEALLDRTFETARRFEARAIGIAGGVSANSRLRQDAVDRGQRVGLPVYLPSVALSTDNAAMIGAAGLRRLRAGVTAPLDLNADASLAL